MERQIKSDIKLFKTSTPAKYSNRNNRRKQSEEHRQYNGINIANRYNVYSSN